MKKFNARENYRQSAETIGYVPRKQATQDDYDRIGFMSGLEVHQQLLTDKKLFCHCPAGRFQSHTDYDAEVIRHMRPTLSELGEYDGTALMEFKTRKEIVYRLKNETACTYEVDDTPPFPIDRQALEIALEISLLSKLNIVGEVHITRKQYLDGSIPTGFQRTAILGVEGEIYLKDRPVRLIQLSIEEDSCREISDIGHVRVYKTDRLGMPLIETVTYPDMVNPDEVKEACNYIRFLNRSTGKVRTGIGAGRQDVNVSCKGGTRVEIKGVARTRWIPELTHNEAFRQWALLNIRSILRNRLPDYKDWKMSYTDINHYLFSFTHQPLLDAIGKGYRIVAVNLPGMHGILSHFTQPGHMFANEIMDRLKVIACIEKPNMTHSEEFEPTISTSDLSKLRSQMHAGELDAQIIFWGPEEDIKTALETIEERCRMAFEGVPNETRKSFVDGTTIFERVLPGADRMYPDTDSAPIPLADSYIDELRKRTPTEIIHRYHQLREWGIPEDTYTYIFSKNLFPLIQRVAADLDIDPKYIGTFIGQRFKNVEGKHRHKPGFKYEVLFALFRYLKENKIDLEMAAAMIPIIYDHPKMDFESVLISLKFKRMTKDEIASKIPFLKKKFLEIRNADAQQSETNWIIGQLRGIALGNINLTELTQIISSHN